MERLISAPAIQFKGSGWYVNDYAGKKSAAKGGESSGESKPAAAAEAKPAAPEKSSAPVTASSTAKSE
ncbi:MAG TPA: hypothetical protein VFW25_13565 [Silvibacterium sp.]|nr:hypothetical protein [Silvibacterium sp.]